MSWDRTLCPVCRTEPAGNGFAGWCGGCLEPYVKDDPLPPQQPKATKDAALRRSMRVRTATIRFQKTAQGGRVVNGNTVI